MERRQEQTHDGGDTFDSPSSPWTREPRPEDMTFTRLPLTFHHEAMSTPALRFER